MGVVLRALTCRGAHAPSLAMTLGSPLMRLGPGSYYPWGVRTDESTGFSESRRVIVLPAEHLNPSNRPWFDQSDPPGVSPECFRPILDLVTMSRVARGPDPCQACARSHAATVLTFQPRINRTRRLRRYAASARAFSLHHHPPPSHPSPSSAATPCAFRRLLGRGLISGSRSCCEFTSAFGA
jgi:hypothetical protein